MDLNNDYLIRGLMAEVPNLPLPMAQRLVDDAWLDIQKAHEWSFRHKEGIVIFPASIVAGNCSLTQFTRTGTFDATALAALNAATARPLLSLRQIRFPSKQEAIFEFESLDLTTGAFTLDKLYYGNTNPTSTYTVYSAYVYPLQGNGDVEPFFERLLTLRSLDYGFSMLDGRHLVERRVLDTIDPGRTNYGLPRAFTWNGSLSQDISIPGELPLKGKLQRLEFWPHCNTGLNYQTWYIQRAWSFSENPTGLVPDPIPSRLIMARALINAYSWADANKAAHPEYRNINWIYKRSALANESPMDSDSYPSQLRRAIRQDNEIFEQTILPKISDYSLNPLALPTTLIVQSS